MTDCLSQNRINLPIGQHLLRSRAAIREGVSNFVVEGDCWLGSCQMSETQIACNGIDPRLDRRVFPELIDRTDDPDEGIRANVLGDRLVSRHCSAQGNDLAFVLLEELGPCKRVPAP